MKKSELELLIKATKDPFFFASFAYIVHPILGKIRFDLFPFQKKILWEFLTHRFNIILKARQMGLTEIIAFYALWLASFHPYTNIQIISLKDRVAKKVMRRIKFIYLNLPPILQTPIVNGQKHQFGTVSEVVFNNHSSIVSIPTTEDAGRSEAVTLLIMDEAAIMQYAETIWAAAFPTLATGGSAIVNSCISGDTVIIGRDHSFRVDEVAPTEFGKNNLEHLGLQVLTHTGKWQRVLGSVNKGKLLTWEIKTESGDTLKCTPAHKLLTPQGWKPVKEIIANNLNIITFDTGLSKVQEPPITIPPKEEELRSIPGFPKYLVSNLGKIFINLKDKPYSIYGHTLKEKAPMINLAGYKRISLHHNKVRKKFLVSRLVAEVFIGRIPTGFVVDHINTNITDNHVTNLEIISRKENASRAIKYSRGLTLNNNTGKGFPDLILTALIKEKSIKYGKIYGAGKRIAFECSKELGIEVTRKHVQRVIRGDRNLSVGISKISLVKEYTDTIYDISVEEDASYITDSKFVSHNTPYGIGGFFYQTWSESLFGANGFNPIKVTWDLHPERDLDWYKSMRRALGVKRTAQEIDCDFLASGDTVFDLSDIKAIEDDLPYQPPIEKRLNGNLLIFKRPIPNKKYYLGADIASGRAHDYSAFSIMDEVGDEVAAFKGRIPINRFRDLLAKTGKEYNYALLAPEANDIGEGLVAGLQEIGYPNLYYTHRVVKEKGSSKLPIIKKVPGWYTTAGNRSNMIMALEEDIREDVLNIKDPFFINEAYTFIYNEQNKPVALNKGEYIGDGDETYTDDAIMAKAITNFIRRGKYVPDLVIPPK